MSLTTGDLPVNIPLLAKQWVRADMDNAVFEPFYPADLVHTHVATDITDSTTVGRAVMKATDAAAGRTAIGAGTSSFSGSYTDLTNKPTIPTVPSYSQSPATRAINGTAFVPSSTRNMAVVYSVDIAATLSLSGGQTGTMALEISANGTTGWVELSRFTNGNTGTLTLGLNITQTSTGVLSGTVPAGYSARLNPTSTGSPTYTYRSGQETAIL